MAAPAASRTNKQKLFDDKPLLPKEKIKGKAASIPDLSFTDRGPFAGDNIQEEDEMGEEMYEELMQLIAQQKSQQGAKPPDKVKKQIRKAVNCVDKLIILQEKRLQEEKLRAEEKAQKKSEKLKMMKIAETEQKLAKQTAPAPENPPVGAELSKREKPELNIPIKKIPMPEPVPASSRTTTLPGPIIKRGFGKKNVSRMYITPQVLNIAASKILST